mgnify:FL=1
MYTRFIFDLDGTVIDSAHRQGESLADWRRLNTVSNVLRDSLLPLADKMRGAIREGREVWICTSRVMGAADYAFLRLNGLHPLHSPILSRNGEADARGCGELKLAKLRGMAAGMGVNWVQFAHDSIMFDDSPDVQNTLRPAGLRVIDPVQYNFTMQQKASA